MGELLNPGQTFAGRYRVLKRIALGGMGAVFAAEQIATELPVAIKVLYPHILGSVDAIEKFTLESRIAARLNSEHIVRMYDAGYDEESRLPFLVMELLHGQDLQKLVELNGPFPPEAVANFIAQVSKGLDRAHSYVSRDGSKEPIVHRDLKPENLFLTRGEDGRKVVRILDFGMAKVIGEAGGVSRDIKGTPLFMAYEQASGETVSPQTDIWALGLTTFYLLTGRNYWKTASSPRPELASLFGEILTLPLVPPSARAKELGLSWALPLEFDHWFLKCLDRDPLMRFPSAPRAAVELEQALGTSARAPSDVIDTGIARTRTSGPHLGATQTSGRSSFPAFSKTLSRGTATPGDPTESDEIALPMRRRLHAPRWSRKTLALTVSSGLILGYGASLLREAPASPNTSEAPGTKTPSRPAAPLPTRAPAPAPEGAEPGATTESLPTETSAPAPLRLPVEQAKQESAQTRSQSATQGSRAPTRVPSTRAIPLNAVAAQALPSDMEAESEQPKSGAPKDPLPEPAPLPEASSSERDAEASDPYGIP